MRVFVTGGSGFVGGHLIEALAGAHEVLAMARSERSAQVVEGYGARAARCDLGTVEAADLEGVEVVVHAAGFVEEWGTRAQFEAGNVEGTRRLLAAAREAGVGRFIFIGTEAALFDGQPLVDIDESRPYPQRQRFLYSETKARAEALVLEANGEGMVTMSIRPRLVWGPRDSSVLPAIVEMARQGRFMWIDGGRALTSTTHVSNLCAAVSQALTQGRGGEAYFVADEGTRPMREFLTALAATEGVELGSRSVPGVVVRPVAAVVEGIWRGFGLSGVPPVHRFTAQMMSRTVTVRTDKARRELGWSPVVEVEQGLRAMGAGASEWEAAMS